MDRRYAIIIGINDYEESPLKFCVNDAIEVQRVLLEKCKFKKEDIYLVTSDTNESIKDVTGRYHNALRSIREKIKEQEDSLLFYFAGHGNNEFNKSNLFFHDSGYPIEEIYKDISNLNPKFQFYIIDSCMSGGKVLTRHIDNEKDYINNYITKSSGAMFLYACQWYEYASENPNNEHGLLTYHFLRALSNNELYDDDGILTPGRVQEFVSKETSKESGFQQIPVTENRIAGYYPFAFLEQISKRAVEQEISDVIVEIDSNTRLNSYTACRLDLQELAFNNLISKLVDFIEIYKNDYEVHIERDLNDIGITNKGQLYQWIYERTNQLSLLPLNDIFTKRKNILSPIINSISLLTSLQNSTTKTEMDYTYDFNFYNEYISSIFYKLTSKSITSSSFLCGLLVYQAKWGIVATFIGFMLDWDGESDSIAKNLLKIDYPLLVNQKSYSIVDKIDINFSELMKKNIIQWNEEREEDINSFINLLKE